MVKLYFSTLRVKIEDLDRLLEYVESGGQFIFSSWHQRFVAGFIGPKIVGKPFYIMVSRSRDGEFVSRVVRPFGWMAFRGSRSRGGTAALRSLLRILKRGYIVAHIVDGPTGPAREIKPGLVSLAQKSGVPIGPAYIIYEKCWTLNSWDRFMIPKPFSKVLLKIGELIPVPSELTKEEFEKIRLFIEGTMIREYDALKDYWGKS
jgi:lysophospholipid acyltransferase (LPLAT)-like uncharacterized protein